jgi:hypothetical protein
MSATLLRQENLCNHQMEKTSPKAPDPLKLRVCPCTTPQRVANTGGKKPASWRGIWVSTIQPAWPQPCFIGPQNRLCMAWLLASENCHSASAAAACCATAASLCPRWCFSNWRQTGSSSGACSGTGQTQHKKISSHTSVKSCVAGAPSDESNSVLVLRYLCAALGSYTYLGHT